MNESADAAAARLKAPANGQRSRTPWLLVGGERAVSESNAKLQLSQSALPQRLARLCAEGLVSAHRKAQSMHYALATGAAAQHPLPSCATSTARRELPRICATVSDGHSGLIPHRYPVRRRLPSRGR